MHFVWFLVSKHLRKGFSKCLAFCDILVRALRHICWHLQQTRQSCGVTILPHHLSLARGVEVVLTHLYTVLAHLPNFSGPGFWGRAFRELWLFEVPPQSGSQSQGQQTQPRPVSPCCYMVLYCPNMLSFLVMSIPVLAEKKTSQPFFHTSTSFVTEATPRIVAVIVIWATVFSGDIPDLSEFKLRLLFSSTDTVSYCFENRKGGRTQTGMITLIILKAKLRVVR